MSRYRRGAARWRRRWSKRRIYRHGAVSVSAITPDTRRSTAQYSSNVGPAEDEDRWGLCAHIAAHPSTTTIWSMERSTSSYMGMGRVEVGPTSDLKGG